MFGWKICRCSIIIGGLVVYFFLFYILLGNKLIVRGMWCVYFIVVEELVIFICKLVINGFYLFFIIVIFIEERIGILSVCWLKWNFFFNNDYVFTLNSCFFKLYWVLVFVLSVFY